MDPGPAGRDGSMQIGAETGPKILNTKSAGQNAGPKIFDHCYQSDIVNTIVLQFLPEHLHPPTVEIVPYFTESFRNPSRIDYGTGCDSNLLLRFCRLALRSRIKEEHLSRAQRHKILYKLGWKAKRKAKIPNTHWRRSLDGKTRFQIPTGEEAWMEKPSKTHLVLDQHCQSVIQNTQKHP
ncbi:hypothetical protein C1H46_008222 [Malus baccata]|uniref:Uncharacterized protein n=1 Tax=Malus baccata TaxID=106549 RepID=A0A540N528_MALBA|nr:hypothetical protein C1H46_008222 [Malus baccata]